MSRLSSHMVEVGVSDTLAGGDTAVHRLDARGKLAVTLLFCATVVSFDRYAVSGLVPLAFYPIFLCAAGRIPPGYVLRRMLWVSPFALAVGIFNPFLDTRPLLDFGAVELTAGQVSFVSILFRFALTVGATLALLAVTGFYRLIWAAERLGLPKILAVQLMLFFRYLFVATDEASRMARARSLRSFSRRGLGIRSYGSLAGRLMMRTLDRAERIYIAMTARGFRGEILLASPSRFRRGDALFVAGWVLFFAAVRLGDLSALLGRITLEWM